MSASAWELEGSGFDRQLQTSAVILLGAALFGVYILCKLSKGGIVRGGTCGYPRSGGGVSGSELRESCCGSNGCSFQEIGATGHALILHDVSRYLNDVFMCNASNIQGHVKREMNVSVHFPPEVHIYEEDLKITNDKQIMVTCLVQGSPLVDFYWKFKDVRIETNWKYLVVTENEEGYPLYFMTLMTRPGTLGDYDFGLYICHADGDGQEMEAEIRIHHRPKKKKHWPSEGEI